MSGVQGCNHDTDREKDPHVVQDGRDLPEDPNHLSPPIVQEPLYACATAVTVSGFIPGAKIDVFADGNPIGGGVSDAPWGQRFAVSPALVEGQTVTATQTFAGATSSPSAVVRVRSHIEDYPHGLPVPRIDPTPLYRCGKAVGARDLVPGALLQVFSENLLGPGSYDPPQEVGRVDGTGAAQWLFVNPEFSEGARVTAQDRICADVSPLSAPQIVQPAPAAIPAPSVDDVYEGATHLVVRNVVNGAVIDVFADGARVGGHASPGGSQTVRINPPAAAGSVITAQQTLCNPGPMSPGTTVRPCSELPAARIRPPAAGDDAVYVTQSVLGSRIIVFADGQEVGDGGGDVVRLIRPLRVGETVTVVQRLGACQSSWVYVITVECKPAREVSDPSGSGPYAVGSLNYQTAAVPVMGDSARLWATVRYPAVAAGENADLIPGADRLPLVLFLHGNHGIFRLGEDDVCDEVPAGTPEVPNHEGYSYVLESLARAGFIAVSVNANDLNCKSGRIRERGRLILEHLALWKRLNDPAQPDPIFSGKFRSRVDLGRVGLAGHSRGGEAVVSAALDNADPDISILGVLSLAPVDFHSFTLEEVPLLMILPSADGDVWDNSGAKIYDRARKASSETWFKSQMYVYGANHNYFNREWRTDDSAGLAAPDRLARAEQEAMLRAWARGFFELAIKGKEAHRPVLSGDVRVAGIRNDRVHASYQTAKAMTADHFEDAPDNPDRNSLGGNVSRSGGFMTFDEFQFRQGAADTYNGTFYHDTDGLATRWRREAPSFESEIPDAHSDNSAYKVLSVRVAQASDQMNDPARAMNVRIGLEDKDGRRIDVESATVGSIPYPYAHPFGAKTMMKTLRIPLACFDAPGMDPVQPGRIKAIHFSFDRTDQGTLALDQFEFSE
jgi:hypothetical protein